jgi:stage II sporulation protein D
MALERYLIGVVAAEMPAAFETDALMAQAVAARTNVFYNMYVRPKTNHPDAGVCTDFSCCAAYSSDEQLREKWRDDYTDNIMRIINAVTGTDGEYLSYGNEPILAVFHSSSAGRTETSGNVWITDLPYLLSVYSPEKEADVPDYIFNVTVPRSIFIDTVQRKYPDAALGGDAEESWITDISYTESGRVKELSIGGATLAGTTLRSMFNLRSTTISFKWTNGDIIFTTIGYGHGVGMSQYGANVMANNGIGYKEILGAYYTGTTLAEGILR